jgi:cell division protein FtsW (lipid II flippase)
MTMPSPALGSQPPEEAPVGRRSTELWMLLFAFGIVAFAFASTAFSLKHQHPSTFVEYMVAFVAVIGGAHLAIRKWAPYADPLLLPIATVLNGLGIVMIYRLNQVGRNGNASANGSPIITLSSSATVTQIIYTVLGVIVFVLFLWRIKDIRILQPYTYVLGLVGVVLIAIPALLPASISGVAGTGAKIQVSIGGFSVQPEEFGKLLLAASFASYLVANGRQLSLLSEKLRFLPFISLPRRRDLLPILVVWAVSMVLLILESDIGTSAVFMGLFVAMLYIATSRRSWVVIGFGMFVVGAYLAATAVAHVGQRFSIWLHPFTNANLVEKSTGQPSYQLVQGLYGMANGGLLGKGLGGGQPFWTPLVQSDLIFTAFGEELGLTGVMALLLLYALFVQRGLRTALLVKDDYSKLLASGLAFMFALQVFVIVGGVTRLIPLTGITTPFLSQGGSSLVASWLLVAVFARLSDSARRPAPRPIQDEGMTQVVSLR